MSQQLGKVEKPPAGKFKAGRKLFFVPLIITPLQVEPELMKLLKRYWEQAEEQVKNLEGKLTEIKKVYHELIPAGGKKGLKTIEELGSGSHQIVKGALKRGAKLRSIEDSALLGEFMDWSKCLAIGLQSQAAIAKVYQSYLEVQNRRYAQMAQKIDKTLAHGTAGMLLIREGHQVQFPSDIQIFYVSPPSLDEIRRWFRDRQSEPQA